MSSHYLAYVHLKDVSPAEADAQTFPILKGNEAMPDFCELGLGLLAGNFKAIIDFLKDTHYEGWVTDEINRSTSTPYNSLQICRNFVQRQLGLSL